MTQMYAWLVGHWGWLLPPVVFLLLLLWILYRAFNPRVRKIKLKCKLCKSYSVFDLWDSK